MAAPITSAICQVLTLTTKYDLTVTDSAGVGRTVTLGTNLTPTYWRTFLASSATPTTPSTTITSPKSLIAHLQAQLNAAIGSTKWLVTMSATGSVQIQWTGATNPATITWDAGNVIRNALGFTAGVSLAPNATATATYHPTHTIYSVSRRDDTGWIIVPQRRAVAELPNGTVFGWQDGTQRRRRSFTLGFHPYDWSTRSAAGANGTPLWGDSSRETSPSITAGVVPPWSLSDFFATCLGYRCGAALGTYQTVLTGATTTCDAVYVGADTLTADAVQALEQANNSNWYRWPGVVLWRYGSETL